MWHVLGNVPHVFIISVKTSYFLFFYIVCKHFSFKLSNFAIKYAKDILYEVD